MRKVKEIAIVDLEDYDRIELLARTPQGGWMPFMASCDQKEAFEKGMLNNYEIPLLIKIVLIGQESQS